MYFLVFHGEERFGKAHAHDHHDDHAHHKAAANDHSDPHALHDSGSHHEEDAHDDHGHHGLAPGQKPHESPWVVTVPLVLLAIPSMLIGFFTIGRCCMARSSMASSP